MKVKRNSLIIWIVAIVLFISAISISIFLRKSPIEKVVQIGSVVLDDGEQCAELNKGYACETSYSGSKYVPASMFSYPFRKTDDYIMNKDYVNIIGAENAKILSDRVIEAFNCIYNINYETLDKDEYKAGLEGYVSNGFTMVNANTGDIYEGAEEIAELLTKLAVEDEVIIEAKAVSDRSMVFYDESCDIVRAKVTLVVYSCKDDVNLKSFLGVDTIEIGRPFSVIYDVYTGPNIILDERSSFVIQAIKTIN